MFTNKKNFLALVALCLAPLSCGSGSQSTDGPGVTPPDMVTSPDKRDMSMLPQNGTLVLNIAPMGIDMMVELDVDGDKMTMVKVGSANEITLKAGSHDVRLLAPGYGYAVPGYNWSGGDVSKWTITDLVVNADAKVNVSAILCRDLTGTWNTLDGPKDVDIAAFDGKCVSRGFSPIDFVISGDRLTANSSSGCEGTEAVLSEDALRIDIVCGGQTLTFTKVQ